MCNYCGCRAIEPVAELTAEHEQILNLSGEIRSAVVGGDHAAAAARLHAVRAVLKVHDAVEELALYPAMARLDEFGEMIGTLFDEHDEFDHVVQAALTAVDRTGPPTADWVAVLTALELLGEHIDHEEHGVFPAAAVSLDPADWEHAAAVRREQTAQGEQPDQR